MLALAVNDLMVAAPAVLHDTLAIVPAAATSGLQGLWNKLMTGYVQWIFIGAVAIFSLVFIKDRKWMQLLSFVGIAAIVGVLIFGGEALFGKDKGITKAATSVAKEIK